MARLLITVAALATIAAAPTDALDSVIAANYPARLTAVAARFHYQETRQSAFVTLSLAGANYVVAAYSNGRIGSVVLLKASGNGYSAVDTFDHTSAPGALSGNLVGRTPMIAKIALGGRGAPLVAVTMYNGRHGASTWIFSIVGDRLTLTSPLDRYADTPLADPDYVDLSGTGTPDIINTVITGPSEDQVVTYQRYVYRNGAFVESEPLDFYDTFYRAKGTPKRETATFDVPAAALSRRYRLLVVNGISGENDLRVSAGDIVLNGVTVSGPNDFGEQRAAWSVPVALQEHNTLGVRLEGKDRARVVIAIAHE